MNQINYSLLSLFDECAIKVATLTLLDRDHELTLYNTKNLALGENSRLLVRFMKRFCPGAKNPALPSQYELFIAMRAFMSAVDDAIWADLLLSVETVLGTDVIIENPDYRRIESLYKFLLREIDSVTLAQQSTLHIGRS